MLGYWGIVAISTILFLYWLRTMCVMLLRAQTSRDYTREVAAANRLSVLEVRDELNDLLPAEESDSMRPLRGEKIAVGKLDRLCGLLHRDYAIVTGLLQHTARAAFGDSSVEEWMLRTNYQLVRFWFQLMKRIAPQQAVLSLHEMARTVSHFADSMGERAVGS